MSENENVKVDDVEDIGNEPEDGDTTDWKAEALKARGIAKRNATRLEKLKIAASTKIEEVKPTEKPKIKTEFDYAEKAFLRANDIKANEYEFVYEVMTQTGKSLDEVLESKYFQLELKDKRESQAVKEAVPSGSKRSNASARDSVDYWVQKGELPPRDQFELRKEVLKARIAIEKNQSQFTNNPIV